MSKDLKLESTCDHYVCKEPIIIDDDMKTVRLMRILSSSRDVKLYLNGFQILSNNPIFGWSLVQDPLSVDTDKKNIMFSDPLKSDTDIIEVSYFARPDECRKCHSYRIYDDFSFSIQGNIVLVSDTEKLAQDVEKIVITIVGSNPHHSWYGTRLLLLLGSANDPQFSRIQISSDVSDALRNLLDIQLQQYAIQWRYMTDEERIDSIDKLDAWVDEIDPTRINVNVVIVSKAGKLIEINKTIRF